MNNVLVTGIFICQILRYVFETLYTGTGEEVTLPRIPGFKYVLATMGAPHGTPGCCQKIKSGPVGSHQKFTQKSPRLWFKAWLQSHWKCLRLVKQDVCLPILLPQAWHLSVRYIKRSPNNLPFRFIMWNQRQETGTFSLSQFSVLKQVPSYSLVSDHKRTASFTHFLLTNSPPCQMEPGVTNSSKSCGIPYPCPLHWIHNCV